MRVGKVPPNLLQRLVFSRLGAENNAVVGPGIGLDATVIKLDDRSVVVAADPITASVRDIGMLAVHVNANDVAMIGEFHDGFCLFPVVILWYYILRERFSSMKTATIKIPEELDREAIRYAKEKGFASKSEFIRYAIRRMLEPDLKPEVIAQIIQARESIERGEGLPIEKVKHDLDLE